MCHLEWHIAVIAERPPAPPAPDQGIDAGVIEDARARQQRHRRVGAALLTGVVALGILVLVLGGGAGGGAGAARDRHGQDVGRASAVAPDGEYSYLATRSMQGGPPMTQQWWVANDGSGRVITSSAGRRWSETFGAGGYDSLINPKLGQPAPLAIGAVELVRGTHVYPERLPTGSMALADALRAEAAREIASSVRAGVPRWQLGPEATKELWLVANALQDPMDPPALRSALFAVARTLPGIVVQHGVTDHLGRRGEAITASEGVAVERDGTVNDNAHEMFAVIFNPKTRQILGEAEYPSDHPEQASDWYVVFTGGIDTRTDTTIPKIAG